jgi:hypothetical protein
MRGGGGVVVVVVVVVVEAVTRFPEKYVTLLRVGDPIRERRNAVDLPHVVHGRLPVLGVDIERAVRIDGRTRAPEPLVRVRLTLTAPRFAFLRFDTPVL